MEVSALTLAELEQLLEACPWFTLARKEYVRRRKAFGEEELREAAARAGIYLLSRSEFLAEITGKQPRAEVRRAPAAVPAEPVTEPAPAAQPAEAPVPEAVPAPAPPEGLCGGRRLLRQRGFQGAGRSRRRDRQQAGIQSDNGYAGGNIGRGGPGRCSLGCRREFRSGVGNAGPHLLRPGTLRQSHSRLRKTNFAISRKKCLLCSPYRKNE